MTLRGRRALRLSRLDRACLALALSYLLNDAEELVTYRSSSQWLAQMLPEWVPPRGEVSQQHVTIAIGLIGVHWVGASLAGWRSGGRSAWFQNAAAAFGLHGFAHLGLCALRRGYVSGAVTAPAVIGLGAWTWRVLHDERVPSRVSLPGIAASLPVLAAAHAGAEVLLAGRRSLLTARPATTAPEPSHRGEDRGAASRCEP